MVGTINGPAVAIFAALLMPAQAQPSASVTADVMAAVRQVVDGFNKGDVKMLSSACAEQVAIIDEFPPHAWQGPGACTQWWTDFEADAKKSGLTDALVSLGEPSHIDVTADRAYVVTRADLSYKVKGQPVEEVGSIFTIALHKGSNGWRVTGWSWARQ